MHRRLARMSEIILLLLAVVVLLPLCAALAVALQRGKRTLAHQQRELQEAHAEVSAARRADLSSPLFSFVTYYAAYPFCVLR